jgi:hypothetical protein
MAEVAVNLSAILGALVDVRALRHDYHPRRDAALGASSPRSARSYMTRYRCGT